MTAISSATETIVCQRCNQDRQRWEFLSDYGGLPDLRVCRKCNRCPDCGANVGGGGGSVHRCNVPLLTAALGVDLTTREKKLIAWMALMLDLSDALTLAELFFRSRGALAEPVAPEVDPWAEFDHIAWVPVDAELEVSP